MDSDFQLFSPHRQSGGDESRGIISAENTNSDWTQWMRWDEPILDENNHKPIDTNMGLPFVSPPTTMSSPNTVQQSEVFPNLPLGMMQIPSGLSDDRSRNLGLKGSIGSNFGLVSPISSVGVGRKRKNGTDDDSTMRIDPVQPGKKMPAKKRAHNVIEKRYRANLNEKIAELRDSVPSLRAMKPLSGYSNDDEDDADGTLPANKLNKASILSKATEYIKHLETRNKRLEDENTALKNQLRQVDKAADQAVTSSASVSSPSNYTVSGESNTGTSPSVFSQAEEASGNTSDASPSPQNPPEGLIKVPDAWRRMREEGKKGIFAESYMTSTPRTNNGYERENERRRSKLPNKYMLGALAGLMVLEGFGSDKSDTEAKGLLAVPLNLLSHLKSPNLPYLQYYIKNFWYTWHLRAIIGFLVLATLILASAFIIFLYLFNAQPITTRTPVKIAAEKNAAPKTSNFRQQAWLTSMQRAGVPRHRFWREWAVVTSRWFEYVLRCLMGWKLYSWATGITEEDEKGRVKTWDIAIDAQLTGGDTEISKSRLVLTIFAAGTLPRSPVRMMLKALHVRILLYRVGEPGSWTFHISNDIARTLARYQWAMARDMNNRLPENHPNCLPPHLAALISLDCEDVMTDSITQRAVNLVWNQPTQEGTLDDEVLLDVVDEDPAIQCPVDALAAWYSCHLLQASLLKYLEASGGGLNSKPSRDCFKKRIHMALESAPRLSAAYTRALVMKSVFFETDRIKKIDFVLAALPRENSSDQSRADNFIDSSLPVSVRNEIALTVRCAMIAAVVTGRSSDDSPFPASFTIQKAINWFNELPIDPVELSLLGFSAVYHLLHLLASDVDYIASSDSSAPSSPTSETACSADDEAEETPRPVRKPLICPRDIPNLGRVAAQLIYWAQNAYNPIFYGFSPALVEVIVKSCTSVCANAGINVDDYFQVASEPISVKKRRHRRRRENSEPAPQSDADQDAVGSHIGKILSFPHERSASNDTGYGSLSSNDEINSRLNLTEKVLDIMG
ncbi:hypothetical protein N7495_007827 [Penicillium taxi]|uniref:uncharacterized protein n=1 Tax=Penicillium taxi TaxID=168475 RepID=UPI0025459635|nr:uncharacterized protein N7495_007827 [Penicillium taxi]KAJ5887786.1 hypothetical protein N7495_007827 [Penicillium taxi]